ncbi:MAG: hypothetical protein ACOC97_00535 [Myxococcota bacterium]
MTRASYHESLRTGALAGLLIASGCTGLTADNDPGEDTYLEGGAIAVDDRTETAFVLQTVCDDRAGDTCRGSETKTVHAIHPDDGPLDAFDVTGLSDLRILFPDGSVMIMGERGTSEEEIRLLDPTTLEPRVAPATVEAQYRGTRMSQSRRWLAVADNAAVNDPIHIIDASDTSLPTREIPHDGQWLEAMWLNQSDELVAIVFDGEGTGSPSARILSWTMQDLSDAGFPEDSGFWASPNLDITVPDTEPDALFSYTWVGVHPDDEYAVFPVRQEGDHRLLVLNLADEELRTVPDARGPVGFSPDGSTIVSYRYDDMGSETDTQLLLIDTETLDEEPLSIPIDGGPTYFVTREGNSVVVASNLGNQPLVLYDLDMAEVTELGGPNVGLTEFVSRVDHGELWIVDDGLHRLDFLDPTPTIETVALDWTPAHVNILRVRDQLVLDDADGDRILFWSPSSRETVREVLLPEPAM